MAASPSDPIVAMAFGGAIMRSAAAPGPASRDGMGVRFVFVPPPGDTSAYALDIELRQVGGMPAEIMDALGTPDAETAFRRWTELEVEAKLTGVPVLALLRQRRPATGHIALARADTKDHWIAIGKWISSK